jgi:hypothetical protein
MTVDRRSFLNALIGLGAAVALPLRPTDEQVDAAWEHLVQQPFMFEVNEYGTIAEPDAAEPKVRSDVYDINTAWISTPGQLVDTVEEYPELLSHFVALAANELEDAQMRLERKDLPALDRKAAAQIVKLIGDPDSDWATWIRAGGGKDLPGFLHRIDEWLASPVQWRAMEWWPSGWSGEGRAMSFFRSMDDETLDALGVVIVEGEHPGSSYYAAELQQPVDETNAMAKALGLPFRFGTAKT